MPKQAFFNPHDTEPNTLLLGTYVLGANSWPAREYFLEFENLTKTLGIEPCDKIFISLRTVSGITFLTKGKLADLVRICEKENIERIICSSTLTPIQQRNLEEATNTEVMDRTQLILEIFKKSATSAEGKLQVEIAEINISKTKMAGLGLEMGQQQAGTKARGPGETQKEYQTRHYASLIEKATKKLKNLKQHRELQRKQRMKTDKPLVSLVGYTNAGKSSLLNLLSKHNVLVEDKLFATLDTTTREVFLEQSKKMLLSDTVGFISHLPHHLIKAFHSTLDELRYADLLLHVIDISNSAWREQIEVVQKTLRELKINTKLLFVCNKIDQLNNSTLTQITTEMENEGYDFVFTHTLEKGGVIELKQRLIHKKEIWSKGWEKDKN